MIEVFERFGIGFEYRDWYLICGRSRPRCFVAVCDDHARVYTELAWRDMNGEFVCVRYADPGFASTLVKLVRQVVSV